MNSKQRQAKKNQLDILRVDSEILGFEESGFTPSLHASTHQNGGADEINVGGLSGTLADAQTPSAHATSHISTGADPIPVATPTATGLSPVLANQVFLYLDSKGIFSVINYLQGLVLPSPVNYGVLRRKAVYTDGWEEVRNNVTNSPPGVGDDSGDGYSYFSRWIDTSGPDVYECVDPTLGAAVWVRMVLWP